MLFEYCRIFHGVLYHVSARKIFNRWQDYQLVASFGKSPGKEWQRLRFAQFRDWPLSDNPYVGAAGTGDFRSVPQDDFAGGSFGSDTDPGQL